jgi:hypothetical protein
VIHSLTSHFSFSSPRSHFYLSLSTCENLPVNTNNFQPCSVCEPFYVFLKNFSKKMATIFAGQFFLRIIVQHK